MASITLQDVSLRFPVLVPLSLRDAQASGGDPDDHAGAMVNERSRKVKYIEALKDVSFHLKSGDRLGLIGRNGSGKSTLLRVLGGIYEPTSGLVDVRGNVAPMFNINLGIQKEATGRRNIIIRGLLSGLTHKQAKSKIEEIAEFSGLGRFLDMPVRTYSQGMAMRLAFATATAFSPEVLLLDEWIGAGDSDFRDKARQRMNEFVDEAGITVIASHNRALLQSVCSLGLWLDRGVMRAFGPIEEVYEIVDEWKRHRTADQGNEVGAVDNTSISGENGDNVHTFPASADFAHDEPPTISEVAARRARRLRRR